MGRLDSLGLGPTSDIVKDKQLLEDSSPSRDEAEDGVVVEMTDRPDSIPPEVWVIIQENGEVATRRLNDILNSPKFMRLRAGDQAKLIQLAQDRAYGKPQTNKPTDSRTKGLIDATQGELNGLVSRAALPEYKRSGNGIPPEDAIVVAETERMKGKNDG